MHVTVFMAIAFGIARSPSRLADRVGRWLTPALLALLALLCGVTVLMAPGVEREAIEPYAGAPLTTGLTQGYLTSWRPASSASWSSPPCANEG